MGIYKYGITPSSREAEARLLPPFSPTKENYIAYRGQKVLCRGRVVTVAFAVSHRTNAQWALLRNSRGSYSANHGKSWHTHEKLAMRSTGKMRLDLTGETNAQNEKSDALVSAL